MQPVCRCIKRDKLIAMMQPAYQPTDPATNTMRTPITQPVGGRPPDRLRRPADLAPGANLAAAD